MPRPPSNGTRSAVEVVARDRPTARRASEAAIVELEATERRPTTWRENGELARVNRAAPGRVFELSAALGGEPSPTPDPVPAASASEAPAARPDQGR